MASRIAIVSAACEFPEGNSPSQLWDSALHGRRSFRAIPATRLGLTDYPAGHPDGIGDIEAGLLEDWQFDRAAFRIPESLFLRTDMAQWLALDVATRAWNALATPSRQLEADGTAVIVANTLTGEFSRANQMRYRWPYVANVLRAAGSGRVPDLDAFIRAAEAVYKAPFPPPDEDSLAGALSNTIAGRISNHHSLRGGAHTVDGACASSLVAVAAACDKLAAGDAACVLVGAVDLSLDPFELVGFARNGALAGGMMKVFDQHSRGFWPGEGCGFMVLAREEVAKRHGWPVLGWILGTGMSTDGAGAMTRPTANGQTLAAQRAWAKAGLSPMDADYFEGHGTGTPTGDPIELVGLSQLLVSVPPTPIPIGSIKANIGHTKAAAGMAGLLKALMLCDTRVVPATTGCDEPDLLFEGPLGERLAAPAAARGISHGRPVTVGVNSFGFGGVNCHVVLQGLPPDTLTGDAKSVRAGPGQPQGELFVLAADSSAGLCALLSRLAERAVSLSHAQLADLAQAMVQDAQAGGWRACCMASTPRELQAAATQALQSIQTSPAGSMGVISQIHSWSPPRQRAPRVALVFPGQGLDSQAHPEPWGARFPFMQEQAQGLGAALRSPIPGTDSQQRGLAEIAIASVLLLENFGVKWDLVLGHSFGELSALHASGQLDAAAFRRLAGVRGECMQNDAPTGAMLALHCSRQEALDLAAGDGAELACENAPAIYVVAGTAEQMSSIAARCAKRGIAASLLPATRAFHSRLMRKAGDRFATRLGDFEWEPARVPMISTVTGNWVDVRSDVRQILADQVTSPVRFSAALALAGDADIVIEAGTPTALRSLLETACPGRVVSLGLFAPSLQPLLGALGAVWVWGGSMNPRALFEGRAVRHCGLDHAPAFLENACASPAWSTPVSAPSSPEVIAGESVRTEDAAQALRGVLRELTGFDTALLTGTLRLLADLHLNSIKARHAVTLAARRMGLAQLPFDLGALAHATIDDIAQWLRQQQSGEHSRAAGLPAGVAPWLRMLKYEWQDTVTAPGEPAPLLPAMIDDSLAPLPAALRAMLRPARDQQPCMRLLVLPASCTVEVADALLVAVREAAQDPHTRGLLVLQAAQLANGFLQSAAAEQPRLRLCAVEYERLDDAALKLALSCHALGPRGYAEMRLRSGRPQHRAMAVVPAASPVNLEGRFQGVAVFTGGGRGIGAACAVAFARQYRCPMAIIGRSPASQPEVQATLAQLLAVGADARYYQADLCDGAAASGAIAGIELELGPVTALLHAAGINEPAPVLEMSSQQLQSTLRTKVHSLEHLLSAIPPGQLRLVAGFGSIIGELGLAGEAHYALANEWLGQSLERYARGAAGCRVTQISWSAWRSTGMASRMEGVLTGLDLAGTRALETEEALAAFMHLLERPQFRPVIVCGRYGRRITAAERQAMQAFRYLETPRVFYPAIELVADAQLDADLDLYLPDHAPFGSPVFPLVAAIEAMVCAAQCLCGRSDLPMFRDLLAREALTVPARQRTAIRTQAVASDEGSVRVEIRCESTGFEVVHFSATLSWPEAACDGAQPAAPLVIGEWPGEEPAAGIVYSGLCFHGPRFQRLSSFGRVTATTCAARIAPSSTTSWFGAFAAQSLSAGDPCVRDAVIHALQACVPYEVVLPAAAGEVRIGVLRADAEFAVSARQTSGDANRFVFDISIRQADGREVESWTALEFVRVGSAPGVAARPLAAALLPAFLGRIARDVMGDAGVCAGLSVGQAPDPTCHAVADAIGAAPGNAPLSRRADGALELAGWKASSSHAGPLTVALAKRQGELAIDLQFDPGHSDDEWRALLGAQRMAFADGLASQGAASTAQCRLAAWTASECLSKLGQAGWSLPATQWRRIDTAHAGALLLFSADGLQYATGLMRVAGHAPPLAFCIALAA